MEFNLFKYIFTKLNKKMNNFSISQLSRFSGIKPHTIRIWEQRYNALKPHRTEGNTRYYDGSQLRRLLNIVSLLQYNRKISDICSMPDEKLFSELNLLQEGAQEGNLHSYYHGQLLGAIMNFQEADFDRVFGHCVLHLGLRQAYSEVVYPIINRMGMMWAENVITPAQEHFASNLIRQKLFTAIDGIPASKTPAGKWLLFLPEEEFHELGLLFASYIIRQTGNQVVYLGANIPFSSLSAAAAATGANNLLLFLIHRESGSNTRSYLERLSQAFPAKKIFISQDPSRAVDKIRRKNIHYLHSIEDLERELQEKGV